MLVAEAKNLHGVFRAADIVKHIALSGNGGWDICYIVHPDGRGQRASFVRA
jgi:hypothetical protein